MDETLKQIALALRQIDRQLGALAALPALQNAPQYVRAHLTEQRDLLMKEVRKLETAR